MGSALLQQVFQNFFCIHFTDIPLAPIFGLGNLRVQDGAILSYEFAFFFTNFFDDVLFSLRRGVVEDIKAYRAATLALHLINDAILAL